MIQMQHGRRTLYSLHQFIECVGCDFFSNGNHEVSDYMVYSQLNFYHKLLLWLCEFHESFASEGDWKNIV